jgi:hypothetical protein
VKQRFMADWAGGMAVTGDDLRPGLRPCAAAAAIAPGVRAFTDSSKASTAKDTALP